MLNHVGLPAEDMDYIYCDGRVMNKLVVDGNSRMCLFTGSQAVAEKLTADLRGRVKLEDAGFDWKILGPDPSEVDYVIWQAMHHAMSRATHHAAHHAARHASRHASRHAAH